MKAIFLHGLGQTPASWQPVLQKMELDAACPSLPELLEGQPADYAHLYEKFSRYCRGFSQPLWLCGLSLGGILAMAFALEYPERVRALTLIGVQYKMPAALLRVQNGLFRLMPASAFAETGFDKEAFRTLCRSMMELDFTGELSRITCPTLVLCGEKDRPNRKAAEGLAERLNNGALVLLPGAGHQVNVTHPGQLAEALGSWQRRMELA